MASYPVVPLDDDQDQEGIANSTSKLESKHGNNPVKIHRRQIGSQTRFEQLPAEIWCHIISFLPSQQELMACSRVCTDWYIHFSGEISLKKLHFEITKQLTLLAQEDYSAPQVLEKSTSFEREVGRLFQIVMASCSDTINPEKILGEFPNLMWSFERLRPLASGNDRAVDTAVQLLQKVAPIMDAKLLFYKTTSPVKPLLANLATCSCLVLQHIARREFGLSDHFRSKLLSEDERKKLAQDNARKQARAKGVRSQTPRETQSDSPLVASHAREENNETEFFKHTMNPPVVALDETDDSSQSDTDQQDKEPLEPELMFDFTVNFLEQALMDAHTEIQHENSSIFIQVCVQNLNLLGMIDNPKYLEKMENRLLILLNEGGTQRSGANRALQSLLPKYSPEAKRALSETLLSRLESAEGATVEVLDLLIKMGNQKEAIDQVLNLLNPQEAAFSFVGESDLERKGLTQLAKSIGWFMAHNLLNPAQQETALEGIEIRMKEALNSQNSWLLITLLEGLQLSQLTPSMSLTELLQVILRHDYLGTNPETVRDEVIKVFKKHRLSWTSRGFWRSLWVDKFNKGWSMKLWLAAAAVLIAVVTSVSLFFTLLFPTIQSVDRSRPAFGEIIAEAEAFGVTYHWAGPLANCGANRGGGLDWCFKADIPIAYSLQNDTFVGIARGVFCHYPAQEGIAQVQQRCMEDYPVGNRLSIWYDPKNYGVVYLTRSYDSVDWRKKVFHTWFWSTLLIALPCFGGLLYLVYAWRTFRKEQGKAFCFESSWFNTFSHRDEIELDNV